MNDADKAIVIDRLRRLSGPLFDHKGVLVVHSDTLLALVGDRPCTCHPDDNPPVPCRQKYALRDCRAAADRPEVGVEEIAGIIDPYAFRPNVDYDAMDRGYQSKALAKAKAIIDRLNASAAGEK